MSSTTAQARIPGPFEISRKAYGSDPQVNALFGSADDIETLFARSKMLQEFFRDVLQQKGPGMFYFDDKHNLAGFRVLDRGGNLKAHFPMVFINFFVG